MRFRNLMAAMAACTITTGAIAMPEPAFKAWQAEYETAWKALFDGGSAKSENVFAVRKEFVEKLDISDLTAGQIAEVNGRGLLFFRHADQTIDLRDQARSRLQAFTSDPGVEGAVALATLATLSIEREQTPEQQAEILRPALTHAAAIEAARSGAASGLMTTLAYMTKDEAIALLRDETLAYAKAFASSDAIAPKATTGLEHTYRVVKKTGADEATVNDIRLGLIALGQRVVENDIDQLDEGQAKYLRGQIQTLELAPKVENLVGSPAPDLSITWSSGDPITSLKDLRGKVVVLDFWATWCGPCVASFPNVAELVKRYEGYPVVVLGVTSPQGSVIFGGERGTVETEKHEDEFALMPEYIEAKEMTWQVVFTEQDVFNPEYGVRGIPHMTIIGPDGNVAKNGLHPAQPLKSKAEVIDALLKEAGLPCPPPLPESSEG